MSPRTARGGTLSGRGDGPLSGGTALITGVSRRNGIGFAVARRLGELGADLYLQGWRAHDADQPWGEDAAGTEVLVEELREQTGSRLEYADSDLGSPRGPGSPRGQPRP